MPDYSLEQIRQAARNARAAGDEEGFQELLRYAQETAMAQAPQENYDPTEGMSGGQKFLAGVGQGMVDTARSVGNMLGLVDDEKVKQARELDAPLLNTGAGAIGSVAGATALTAPVVGAGAARLAQGSGRLARALQSRGNRVLAEGAAVGAVQADPNERVTGAAQGAALGSVAHMGGRALSRAVQGLVKPTAAAQRVMDQGTFIPLHQAAQQGGISGGAKIFYRDIMRALPFAGGAIREQTDNATQAFLNKSLDEAVPRFARGLLNGVSSPQQAMQKLGDFWDNAAFADLRRITFNTNPNTLSGPGRILRAIAGLGQKQQDRVTALLTGSADDLMRLRNHVVPKLKGVDADAVKNIQAAIDDYVKKHLGHGNNAANQRYKSLHAAHQAYLDLIEGIGRAAGKAGETTPSRLATASGRRAGSRAAAEGRGRLQPLATEWMEALGDTTHQPGFFQHMAVMGSIPAGIINMPATAGALAGGRLLATEGAQRALMGQTNAQKLLAQMIRQHKERLGAVGSAGRAALVTGQQR